MNGAAARLAPATLGVLLIVGLLTWLLLRGIDTNASAYTAALRAIDDFTLAEASLQRDVLEARAGLLRNYDTIVASVNAMSVAAARLRAGAQTEGLDTGATDRLAEAVGRQESLAERFKAFNALLQNSLSYVGMLSTSPAFGIEDGRLAAAADALAAAVLHLSRDTSSTVANVLQVRIDRLAEQAPASGPDAEAVRALLAHASLLRELIPAIDDTLRSIVIAPTSESLEQTRALFSAHRSAVEATAQRFRLLLYIVSMLLLVILVYLGLRLRARALAFHRVTTRLERARRMQAIGSLASGIAHNFNNIISAILGYSEMLEPQLASGTKAIQQIEEIRRAAERGRDLIDGILEFGRRRDGRMRVVRICSLFAETSALLRVSLPAGVDIMFRDVSIDVAVWGEAAQLQQVILNLCNNAAQAMQGGGRILVTANQMETSAVLALSHGELAAGRYVCLAVDDNGRGFDDSVARRLFEPFFTTRMGGTGLGLATAYEIVSDHGGAMHVASKPGRGSRFEAWLPAATPEAATAAGAVSLPFGCGETVLVVAGERDRLMSNEEMLAALGYEPVGFDRPSDAIAACRATPDRFDAILVCDAAAAARALDLAHTLHAAAPLPPVLLAATSTVDLPVKALADAGIAELLSRPLVGSELAAALARCLRRGLQGANTTSRAGA